MISFMAKIVQKLFPNVVKYTFVLEFLEDGFFEITFSFLLFFCSQYKKFWKNYSKSYKRVRSNSYY